MATNMPRALCGSLGRHTVTSGQAGRENAGSFESISECIEQYGREWSTTDSSIPLYEEPGEVVILTSVANDDEDGDAEEKKVELYKLVDRRK